MYLWGGSRALCAVAGYMCIEYQPNLWEKKKTTTGPAKMADDLDAAVAALRMSGENLNGLADYCKATVQANPEQALHESKQYAIDALVRAAAARGLLFFR